MEDGEFVVRNVKVAQSVGNTAEAVFRHLIDLIVRNVEDLQLGVVEESVWQESQSVMR